MVEAKTVMKTKETKPVAKAKVKGNMREIRIEKVVLNIGSGAEQSNVQKAKTLLSSISGMNAVETKAKKRIATWKIRKGLPIGSKVTLRGPAAEELLTRLLESLDNIVSKKSFSENGFSFGIKEYIDIPGAKYDPKVGIIGLDVSVSLGRPGYRIKNRKIKPKRVPKRHSVGAEEGIEFIKQKFKVTIE